MTEEFKMKLKWKRETADFDIKKYNREHSLEFDTFSLPASAPVQHLGKNGLINPELAFISAISSCHMLTFLAIVSKNKFVVNSYQDHVIGITNKNDQGFPYFSKVTLQPTISFDKEHQPDIETFKKLNEKAHKYCLIANSCISEIIVNPKLLD